MKKLPILFELKDFLLLWSSQAISALGTAMTEYALILWTYEQKGTAASITTLTLCSFLPTILFRFAAGTLVDRWGKKQVMLVTDLIAACGTLTIFALYSGKVLTLWHVYLINIALSFANALQAPAAFVATGLLVPGQHYARASGLQSLSGALRSILAPALAAAILAKVGLQAVLLCDMISFSAAILTLFCFVRIPEPKAAPQAQRQNFASDCLSGLHWLRDHHRLRQLCLFMTMVNFLAKLGNDGMLAAFVLEKTHGDQQALATVQSCVAMGLLVGSTLITLAKPARHKLRLIFLCCTAVFASNVVQSLCPQPGAWCAAAFVAYALAAVMGANLATILREQVPTRLQGRVFAAKDTLQNCAIPLGLFLGGVLADHVCEPLFSADSPLQKALAPLFGTGSGAGIALQFFCVGIVGCVLSFAQLISFRRKPSDPHA